MKRYEADFCYIRVFIAVTKKDVRHGAEVVEITPAWKCLVSMACIEHKGIL